MCDCTQLALSTRRLSVARGTVCTWCACVYHSLHKIMNFYHFGVFGSINWNRMPATIFQIRALGLPLCLMRVFVSTLHLKFEFVLSSHTEKPDLALSSQATTTDNVTHFSFHFIPLSCVIRFRRHNRHLYLFVMVDIRNTTIQMCQLNTSFCFNFNFSKRKKSIFSWKKSRCLENLSFS